jgi:myo-inositol-1-phosphate synthase
VGRDLADAIFANPNNTIKISDVPSTVIKVQKAKVLDGIGRRLNERVKISDSPAADVSKLLRESGAEILINYLPVGSREATQYYVEQCLDAGVSFINAIPSSSHQLQNGKRPLQTKISYVRRRCYESIRSYSPT